MTLNTSTCASNAACCANCRLSGICMPLALSADEVGELEEIVTRGRPLQKAATLYEQGSEFKSIFAVRSGAIKTYRVTASGEEHVLGFYLPGEIVGIDGLSSHRYASYAVALDTSAICEIPFEKLESLSLKLPSLQRYFFQMMSREITDDQKLLSVVGKNTADQRVASLLLSISARHRRRQLSPEEFVLPMSRQDIANFLGLTIETVSRVLRRLKDNQIVSVEGKAVVIMDYDALQEMADD